MPLVEMQTCEENFALDQAVIDIAGDTDRGVAWVRILENDWMDEVFADLEEGLIQ